MKITEIRKNYHQRICKEVLRMNRGEFISYLNYSDSSSKASVLIGMKVANLLGCEIKEDKVSEQTVGDLFEEITRDYIEECFGLLTHIRPGKWTYSTRHTDISGFEQYSHLKAIEDKIKGDKELISALGRDYLIKPDIIVARTPLTDNEINSHEPLLDYQNTVSKFTPIRANNQADNSILILHASISCKWTIRSDRSQNTRTEALNLIRNRKGNLPHILAVTAEPLPTRIAALALGTGDLDCVYHFALNELIQAVDQLQNEDQKDMLFTLIEGKRLRDISDLPFDLAI